MKIIVEKGDSISSIAKALNTTPEEIKRINKLTTNILSIGDELTIEENKKIERLEPVDLEPLESIEEQQDYEISTMWNKINEIIDYINNKD